jgi:hypothetical protein
LKEEFCGFGNFLGLPDSGRDSKGKHENKDSLSLDL